MNQSLLNLLGKSVVIALCAAVVAWFYLLAMVSYSGADLLDTSYSGLMLQGTLLGSLTIGLPVSLLTLSMARRHLLQSPRTLAMIVALAGVMMVLASYALAEREGMIMLGAPAFLAAIVYGAMGWFWILRPMREEDPSYG